MRLSGEGWLDFLPMCILYFVLIEAAEILSEVKYHHNGIFWNHLGEHLPLPVSNEDMTTQWYCFLYQLLSEFTNCTILPHNELLGFSFALINIINSFPLFPNNLFWTMDQERLQSGPEQIHPTLVTVTVDALQVSVSTFRILRGTHREGNELIFVFNGNQILHVVDRSLPVQHP